MIVKLYSFFGVVGMASVVAWVMAVCMLLGSLHHRRRHAAFLVALGLGLLATVCARVNSSHVSAIQIDQTEEEAAAKAAQQRMRQEQVSEGGRILAMHFAEDAPGESLDDAGKAKQDGAGSTAPAVAPGPAPEPGEPAYRQNPKQQREAGKKQPVVSSEGTPAAAAPPVVRKLKGPDLILANRLDRLNLLVVRLVLLLACWMLGWDYIARFNVTFAHLYPLPIAGRWVDALAPKRHSVLVTSTQSHPLRQYLETAVRKGETFLYLGPSDPWPEARGLPRLLLGRRGLWLLPKLVCGEPGVPAGSEFLLQAIWFARYCVVLPASQPVNPFLDDLEEFLDARARTGAAVRRTVHVVWDLPALPPPDRLERLCLLCRETNFKLVLFAPQARQQEFADQFEEVIA